MVKSRKINNYEQQRAQKKWKAITIAHLTGQMVTILKMIEFSIQQTSIKRLSS